MFICPWLLSGPHLNAYLKLQEVKQETKFSFRSWHKSFSYKREVLIPPRSSSEIVSALR